MDRAYDAPITQDLHHHAAARQQHAHKLKIALTSAAAAGDISLEDRRVRYHSVDGVQTVDRIAYLCAGFILGGLFVSLLVWWWIR